MEKYRKGELTELVVKELEQHNKYLKILRDLLIEFKENEKAKNNNG